MSLRGRTEQALANLKMYLGIYFTMDISELQIKLHHKVSWENLEDIDTILLILTLGLTKLYIDTANIGITSSIRCITSA